VTSRLEVKEDTGQSQPESVSLRAELSKVEERWLDFSISEERDEGSLGFRVSTQSHGT
jgi:hypothetical protein